MLGLLPVAPYHTLVVDPVLPPWLPEVVLHRLRVGDATATLRFWRDDADTQWDVVHKTGSLRVLRQPPPESLTAGLGDRAWALLQSLRAE
jgi:hypothetical protein